MNTYLQISHNLSLIYSIISSTRNTTSSKWMPSYYDTYIGCLAPGFIITAELTKCSEDRKHGHGNQSKHKLQNKPIRKLGFESSL